MHGKDRTGFIIAVALALCDVDDEAIVFDYTLSQKGLRPLYGEIVRALAKIGLPEEFAIADPHAMRALLQYVREKYGNMSK
jgi:protein tyrosine/serine phosphatase